MSNLVYQCGASLRNVAIFHCAGRIRYQNYKLWHCQINKKPGLEIKGEFIYQESASYKSQKLSLVSHSKSGLDDHYCLEKTEKAPEKNFWGAVGLIVGTAVGPGMLGLPSATIRSGPLPSTLALILSWLYVISSIVIIAELSFVVMEEENVPEVSFTALARKTMGNGFGSFAALIYASLSFSLMVACVSGIGSIVTQCIPWLNPGIACGLFPSVVGLILWLSPFKAIDLVNRYLCILMLFSITVLVGVGFLVGRTNILGSFGYASWEASSLLPAIPVAVLTFGFHVITPFICKIAGNNIEEAWKAILLGGIIPLLMVLSWNLMILGLAGTNMSSSSQDPITLLLSVNSSALPAVRGFAFSALATSLIGYVVSLPKQISDTLDLIFGKPNLGEKKNQKPVDVSCGKDGGKIGITTYAYGRGFGKAGNVSYGGLGPHSVMDLSSASAPNSFGNMALPFVLGLPVLLASLSPSTFSRSLDYAGIYANCFLFGILPPLMMHLYQRKRKLRFTVIPGGNVALTLTSLQHFSCISHLALKELLLNLLHNFRQGIW